MYLQGSRGITIRAWQYEFEPQHIPGRNNVISDALSRVTPLEFPGLQCRKGYSSSKTFYSILQSKRGERDEALQETNKDKELQSLKHYISTG